MEKPYWSRRALLFAGAAALANPSFARTSRAPVRLLGNENPYGPSESAQRAMAEALANGWRYAFAEPQALRKAIAEREDVGPENVLLTAGSSEVLRMCALATVQNGGEVVAARPTFGFLPAYAERLGAKVVRVPLDANMAHDLAAMEAAMGDRTRLVYVCNPNNPTGTVLPGSAIEEFVGAVDSRCPVLIDEAYIELLNEPERYAAIDLVRAGRDVILARTFSKIHGLAGLRVGYAIAPSATISRLSSLKMSMANIVSIAAAHASYLDEDFQRMSRDELAAGRGLLCEAYADSNVSFQPSVTNFVLAQVGDVDGFRARMRAEGFLVGRSYAPFDDWCRVSIGRLSDMRDCARAVRGYFGALTG